METENRKTEAAACEDVRLRNYLITELTVARFRWLIIGFLFLYFNILKPEGWPIMLFNGILAATSAYNLGIYAYIKRAQAISPNLTMVFFSATWSPSARACTIRAAWEALSSLSGTSSCLPWGCVSDF